MKQGDLVVISYRSTRTSIRSEGNKNCFLGIILDTEFQGEKDLALVYWFDTRRQFWTSKNGIKAVSEA